MARIYATRADLEAYLPAALTLPAEPEATRMLTRASEVVDDLLVTAVYDVDAGLLPTDTTVAEALRQATCAQVAWWIETGDETGAAAQYQSVSIGSVSLSRGYSGAGSSTGTAQRISDDAMRHLRRVGLVGNHPLSW